MTWIPIFLGQRQGLIICQIYFAESKISCTVQSNRISCMKSSWNVAFFLYIFTTVTKSFRNCLEPLSPRVPGKSYAKQVWCCARLLSTHWTFVCHWMCCSKLNWMYSLTWDAVHSATRWGISKILKVAVLHWVTWQASYFFPDVFSPLLQRLESLESYG